MWQHGAFDATVQPASNAASDSVDPHQLSVDRATVPTSENEYNAVPVTQQAAAAAPPKPMSTAKTIVLVILALVGIAALVGFGYWMFRPSSKPEEEDHVDV